MFLSSIFLLGTSKLGDYRFYVLGAIQVLEEYFAHVIPVFKCKNIANFAKKKLSKLSKGSRSQKKRENKIENFSIRDFVFEQVAKTE